MENYTPIQDGKYIVLYTGGIEFLRIELDKHVLKQIKPFFVHAYSENTVSDIFEKLQTVAGEEVLEFSDFCYINSSKLLIDCDDRDGHDFNIKLKLKITKKLRKILKRMCCTL